MRKQLLLGLVFPLIILLTSGCWDYKGMDEITIIAGIAVDVNEQKPGEFLLTFEIVDTRYSSNKEEKATYLLQTEGLTINIAVQKLGEQLKNHLSFSHVEILVLSQQVVQQYSLQTILDPFLRDSGIRDNMILLVSHAETANKILCPPEGVEESVNVSFELYNSLNNKQRSVDSSHTVELYELYGIVTAEQGDLLLPAICYSEDETVLVLDGADIFRNGRWLAVMEPVDYKIYLIASTKLSAGSYSLLWENEDDDMPVSSMTAEREGMMELKSAAKYVSFPIRRTDVRKEFNQEDGRLVFTLKVDISSAAIDFSDKWKIVDTKLIEKLDALVEQTLRADILSMLERLQAAQQADVLDFGQTLYDKNPQLWQTVQADWPAWYANAKIQVECSFRIENAGVIRQ